MYPWDTRVDTKPECCTLYDDDPCGDEACECVEKYTGGVDPSTNVYVKDADEYKYEADATLYDIDPCGTEPWDAKPWDCAVTTLALLDLAAPDCCTPYDAAETYAGLEPSTNE